MPPSLAFQCFLFALVGLGLEVAFTAALDGSFAMKLRSDDGQIDACRIDNVMPVSSSLGNVVTMPGCGVTVDGCAGNLIGSGANHALTTSASVAVTPIE